MRLFIVLISTSDTEICSPHSSLLLRSSIFKINMSVEALEPPDISGHSVHQKYPETPALWCFYLGPHFKILVITGIWLAGSFRPPFPTLTFSCCPVKEGLINLCTTGRRGATPPSSGKMMYCTQLTIHYKRNIHYANWISDCSSCLTSLLCATTLLLFSPRIL